MAKLNSEYNNIMNNTESFNIIQKEFELISKDDIFIQVLGLKFDLENNNIYRWNVTIPGPEDTEYKGGNFILQIVFPKDYPKNIPEFKYKTKIYHVNVDPETGYINILDHYIANCFSIKKALMTIYSFFYVQLYGSPFDSSKAELYRTNREMFNEKVKEWIKKYASK